ncbi:MAG: DUF1080 domain-containing protein [Kiritimatiellae bacterium]|nr:DUF1080 domain-containing protein [Kiritimatiellia bacterium]
MCAVLAAAGIGFAQEAEMAPAEPAGMVRLFNGKDLTGWEGDPTLWSVRDGAIHGETTKEHPAKGNTFLILKEGEFGDFELRLSFRVSRENNSGVQYRSEWRPAKPTDQNRWRMKGYQHEIRNSDKLPNVAGFVYDEGGKRGRMCLVGERGTWEEGPDDPKQAGKEKTLGKVITQEAFAKLVKLDDWNEVVIIAKGRQLKHYLNGRLIMDFTDTPERATLKGKIGFQLHAGTPMWTEFKDIRIKQN